MLTLLPTPIGNLEDITFRALSVLQKAEVLLCEDTRVARRLLQLLAERHGVDFTPKTFYALHSHNEAEFIERLRPDFFEREVVYMSDAGMPGISDPGAALVDWCRKNGVAYTVLPGPTAFATAYAASGFASPSFYFAGFLPHKKGRAERLGALLNVTVPVILYESPHRLRRLLEEIAEKAPDRRLFLAKEISKRHEAYLDGTAPTLLKRLEGSLQKGEWVVVVAPCPEEEGSQDALEALRRADMPLRRKAKEMAKITGYSVKECYRRLLEEETDSGIMPRN